MTCLINLGCSTKFIHEEVLRFFYYGPGTISEKAQIRSFVEMFPSEDKKYVALYSAPEEITALSESLQKRNIKVVADKAGLDPNLQGGAFGLDKGCVYVVLEKIEAKDNYSAQSKVEKEIEIINTLHSLFHHKKPLPAPMRLLLIEQVTGSATNPKKLVNAMHKCSDLTPARAALKLNQLISEFSLARKSFSKFVRSAELHSLALKSESIENQIINLWIALESIIPTKPEEREISNIEHIINSITPFLSLGYVDRLMTRFAHDAINWNRAAVRKALKNIDAPSTALKMAILMSQSPLGERADEFRSLFNNFHLLRDRFDYFRVLLSSPGKIHEALEAHNQRISWQIRRIYRARNLIVHSGKTPSYTEVLIENTHDYLDIVMGTLMKLAVRPKQISSIEQGFLHVELTYHSLMQWLSAKGSEFTPSSLEKLLSKRII